MDNQIFNSLDQYFKTLSNYGYMSYDHTYDMMLMIIVQDIITNFACIITQEDYQMMSSLLECKYGTSCLMSYPEFRKCNKTK